MNGEPHNTWPLNFLSNGGRWRGRLIADVPVPISTVLIVRWNGAGARS